MTYGGILNTKRASISPNFAGEKIQTTQNIPNMNLRNGILGLLFMAIVPLSAQTSERGLKECIRMGIERNLGLKNARISIESGRTTVTQARANLLPQVNGTLQAGDYLIRPVNVTTSTLLDADFPDSPTWGKVRTMPLTAQGALQVGVPLYNATIHAAIDAAKVVEDLNRVSYEKATLVAMRDITGTTIWMLVGCIAFVLFFPYHKEEFA